MLDMMLNSEATQTDKRGRRYLAFYIENDGILPTLS